MTLSTTNLLPAILAPRFTTHPSRLGRLCVDYTCTGLWVSSQPYPQALAQHGLQSLPDPFETLLAEEVVNGLPWWEVSVQQSPRTTASQDVEDRVEDLARPVDPRTTSLIGSRKVCF